MIKKGIVCLKEYGFHELYIRAVEKLRSQKISYDKWYKKHTITAEQESAQKEDVKTLCDEISSEVRGQLYAFDKMRNLYEK